MEDDSIDILNRHRQERKELQAKIQALKKTAKNDKSKKKEMLTEINRLEIELESKHQQELEVISKEIDENTSQYQEKENNVNPASQIQGLTKTKVSKAQKRREKKSQLEKEREEQIKLQERENVHGPRNVENEVIKNKLRDRKLSIYQIPSDGDCLYKAILHQYELLHEKRLSVMDIRATVSNYIKQNKSDFMPFMSNPDTCEMLTDEEFELFCDKVKNTKLWGGQLEIRAISNCFKCPIHVIQATGPECIEQGTEFDGPPLIITYHRHMYSLGEHYNSTQITQNED